MRIRTRYFWRGIWFFGLLALLCMMLVIPFIKFPHVVLYLLCTAIGFGVLTVGCQLMLLKRTIEWEKKQEDGDNAPCI